jgi:transposase-like protein
MEEVSRKGIKRRRKYDADFKRDAVIMTFEEDRTVKAVAKDLRIAPDLLSRWRWKYDKKKELASPGNGKEALTVEEQKIRDLEKRLRDVEMERDILKKAVAIFSRVPR